MCIFLCGTWLLNIRVNNIMFQLTLEILRGNSILVIHLILTDSENNSQQQRDDMKNSDLWKLGITLVRVPYWWNESWNQLKAKIHAARPGECN